MSGHDPVSVLREALRLSPDNAPLRQHLAETLLARGELDQAELEFRQALALAPNSASLKVGLARTFFQNGKDSAALVLIESLATQRDCPAAARVLYARLLLKLGDAPRAVAQYKLAIETDAQSADPELASRLGIDSHETSAVVDGRERAATFNEPAPHDIEMERPLVTFQDVGGMESLKEEIGLKIIYPLTHPDIYKAYGKAAGGGVLLYGPPGCGKTHLARATAGEIRATFISVGIEDVLNMWIGESERQLHALFEQARDNSPCVLFFDEVDALGARRSDLVKSGGRNLVNQFLSEMDGIERKNDGLLVLAATNAPWHLDPAFRRPGRFDRVLFVPPPDAAARGAILRILCRGKPVSDLDYEQLSKKTDQFSGADLKNVIDVAIEAKLRAAMKDGIPKPLTSADLIAAAKTCKPTTKEWFSTARNHALYSNQGGAYDDVLKYLKLG